VTPTDLVYDPYDYEIDANPHPIFKRLRDEAPIYYNPKYDFWALSRFKDVLEASLDAETFSSARGTVIELMDKPMSNPPMIFMDPPRHTHFRKLVSRTFTRNRIGQLEGRIRALVQLSGSSLPMIVGVAAITAAKIMGETGDPRRFRSTPAFAAMSGTAPVPASSGQTSRHRLTRGGNRQLNRALHTIALTQSRTDPRAKAYMEKRMSEGKSWLEAMRCLKRHLANVVLRTMLADASVRSGPLGLTT